MGSDCHFDGQYQCATHRSPSFPVFLCEYDVFYHLQVTLFGKCGTSEQIEKLQ